MKKSQMLRFSEYALTRVTLYMYLTFKNIKIYKTAGVPTKMPPYFNLTQNGLFIENGWSDFYETFRNVFFDLKTDT